MTVLAEAGTDTLQLLYDSEINFELSCFWDGGFIWKLGDSANGYAAEGRAASVSEGVAQLQAAAFAHFPQSDFREDPNKNTHQKWSEWVFLGSCLSFASEMIFAGINSPLQDNRCNKVKSPLPVKRSCGHGDAPCGTRAAGDKSMSVNAFHEKACRRGA